MLVVFGPQKFDKTYIEYKVLSKIPHKDIKEIIQWDQGSRPSVLVGGKSHPDALLCPKGWFLGYAYWDQLPHGYAKGTKNLLEISHELWKIEGPAFLKRLNGSFNLFLYDADSGKSLLSTDRFGTYPLWMAQLDDGGVAFSPDYNLLIPMVKGRIDPAGMWSFVVLSRPVANHTLLQQIKGLRQGTAVCFDGHGDFSFQEWYTQIFNPEPDRSLNYWAREFNRCLQKTAEEHLGGINAVGILLSGGTDSRLLASYCPSNTHCFTLADFNNRELKTAAKIVAICGLEHTPIIRDADWYSNTLVPSAEQCVGLWGWNDAHFLMLKDYPGHWQEIDCVVTGIWFDTLFKGCQTPKELWTKTPNLHPIEKAISFCLDVDEGRCEFIGQMKKVMSTEAYENCRQAHRRALSDELKRTIPNAAHLVDAWAMAQFGAIYNSFSFPNIHCLRDFKPVRNLIFDNSIYDMYFRVPAIVRQRGEIVRRALWQRDKSLALLRDSNSWLPAALPATLHNIAIKARTKISHVRNRWYRMTGNAEYRSHGAWTKIAPLWANNPKMRKVMNDIVKTPNPILEQYFSMDSVRRAWKEHQEGVSDYSEILNAVAGLGLLKI